MDDQRDPATAPGSTGARYEIRVAGVLDARWGSWFDGLDLSGEGDDVTVIAGALPDQAALHGLLTRIRDLGLTLISVSRLEVGGTGIRPWTGTGAVRASAAARPFGTSRPSPGGCGPRADPRSKGEI